VRCEGTPDCYIQIQAPSVRADRFASSASHGLCRSTCVSRSVYVVFLRLNNVFGVSCSQMASNINLCEVSFGGLNIDFSELILCIMF